MAVLETEWTCPRCNVTKSVDIFYGNGLKLPLADLWCMQCRSYYMREWRKVRVRAFQRLHAGRLNQRAKEKRMQNRHRSWAYSVIKAHEVRGLKVELSLESLTARALEAKTCQYCGVGLSWDSITFNDHNAPSLDRFTNDAVLTTENTRIACLWCNRSKNTMSMNEFVRRCQAVVTKQNFQYPLVQNLPSVSGR